MYLSDIYTVTANLADRRFPFPADSRRTACQSGFRFLASLSGRPAAAVAHAREQGLALKRPPLRSGRIDRIKGIATD
jgi:hypothetical protein